jgi:hypothetical protein
MATLKISPEMAHEGQLLVQLASYNTNAQGNEHLPQVCTAALSASAGR